ncbi:MAG: MFS transporter [Pseudomonadota bacterium]
MAGAPQAAPPLWQAVLPLAVAETLVWATLYYMFPALLPVWESEFGWTRGEISGAFTASLIVTALISPRAGRIIDRGGSRAMFLGAIAAGALLLVLLSQVTALWQFWAVWLAIGLVNGMCLYEACFAIITVTVGSRAKQAITIVTLVAGFAGTVSFPSAYLLSETLGWRGALLVFAAVAALVALPLGMAGLRLLERHRAPPPAQPETQQTVARTVLRKPAFWCIAFGFAATGLVHGMIISHIRPIMDDRGIETGIAVLIASMVGPMQVVGRVIMVAAQRHVDTFGAAIATFVGMAIGLAALLSTEMMPWLAFAFVVPYGAAYGVISIVRPVLTAEVLGRAGFGQIAGMLAVPYVLGGAMGPVLAAKIWVFFGYDTVLALSLGLVGAGMAAILATRRASR